MRCHVDRMDLLWRSLRLSRVRFLIGYRLCFFRRLFGRFVGRQRFGRRRLGRWWLPVIAEPNEDLRFAFRNVQMCFIILNFNIVVKCPFVPPAVRRQIRYTIIGCTKTIELLGCQRDRGRMPYREKCQRGSQ